MRTIINKSRSKEDAHTVRAGQLKEEGREEAVQVLSHIVTFQTNCSLFHRMKQIFSS